MKKLIFILSIITFGIVLNSCNKDDATPNATYPYNVKMTDAPGPYTAVYIDLQGIEITGNGNATILNIHPGIYNLLNFSNGMDTLVATGSLYLDKVEQIRLILGPNNSVFTGSVTYPLSTPSAQQSGLKLQVHQTLQAGVAYYVLLDFDANQSIVSDGNGGYSLKPVIRTIETAMSGAIQGKLSHPGVMANITATSGGNSYSTVPDSNGNFILKGLPAGTYSVSISPMPPYNSVTLNNVNVTIGNTTTLGIVTI